MELATDRRGAFQGLDYLDPERVDSFRRLLAARSEPAW